MTCPARSWRRSPAGRRDEMNRGRGLARLRGSERLREALQSLRAGRTLARRRPAEQTARRGAHNARPDTRRLASRGWPSCARGGAICAGGDPCACGVIGCGRIKDTTPAHWGHYDGALWRFLAYPERRHCGGRKATPQPSKRRRKNPRPWAAILAGRVTAGRALGSDERRAVTIGRPTAGTRRAVNGPRGGNRQDPRRELGASQNGKTGRGCRQIGQILPGNGP